MEGQRPKAKTRKAKVFGIGSDGRKQYTADPDARAGHRSATNSRQAGPYIGYELHLAVQTRDVKWTNHIDKTSLGPEVAGVITSFSLVPAGTHRGKAVVDGFVDAKRGKEPIDDVVWDPGCCCASRAPPTTSWPRPASTRPSSRSPTSGATSRSPATPC